MPAIAKTDREAILKAALARVDAGGMAALSLRSLAADVGIATNAIYHYFPTRAHLEAGLADEAAAMLLLAVQKGLRTSRDRSRIEALSHAYLTFARRRPHLYDLMGVQACDTSDNTSSNETLWDLVVTEAAQLHGAEDAENAAMSLWALLHGAIALERAGKLGGMKPVDSVQFGLEAWVKAASAKAR